MVEDKVGRDPIGGQPADDCSKEASKEDEVELARAEMSQVREENARLKMLLQKIEKDYNSLQMRFVGVSQPSISETKIVDDDKVDNDTPSGNDDDEEEPVVSLCLGRSCPMQTKMHNSDHDACPGTTVAKENLHRRSDDLKEEGNLRLALDFNNSLEDCKSDPPHVLEPQTKPDPSPLESLKTTKSGGGDDDLSQTGAKRARVSVRTRCDTPTMNDGCQWRKYGQKVAKGNPCPRAYYRCTVAPSCPVRKQVQRCVHDTSILITTYEGNHNHPLPFSATAMASTTSAAASMLLSGSSSSTSQFAPDNSATSTTRPNLPPNSSPAYPTITLDLTSEPSTTSINHFNMFSSGSGGFQLLPRPTSTTSLSFSSSAWANGNLYYGANAMPYRYSPRPGKTSQSQEHNLHQATPFSQKNYHAAAPSQQALTETLTKAITSDPNLRSVIAAAITTMVGGTGGGGANANQESNDTQLECLGKKLKRGDQSTVAIGSSNPAGTTGKGCASSLLNLSSFSTPRGGSLSKQQTQPPFSISKGAAASSTTSENADQTNRMLLD